MPGLARVRRLSRVVSQRCPQHFSPVSTDPSHFQGKVTVKVHCPWVQTHLQTTQWHWTMWNMFLEPVFPSVFPSPWIRSYLFKTTWRYFLNCLYKMNEQTQTAGRFTVSNCEKVSIQPVKLLIRIFMTYIYLTSMQIIKCHWGSIAEDTNVLLLLFF